jgi:hypothetical protein
MNAVDHPSVSVVIPVWDDYVRWLPEAVGSVVAQGVAEQVIVVDNASTVSVPHVDGTIVVSADRRLSTGAARNLGLSAVRTSLVVFLDADDLMLPGALRTLVNGIESGAGVAVFALWLIDAETGRRHRSPRPAARTLARLPRAFALANAVWSLLPTQGATIVRTADVRACGGYPDRSHGEDWVLATSLAWRGRILFGQQPGLLYRSRWDSPGGLGGRPPLLENARAVRERMRSDPGVPAAARAALPMVAILQEVFAFLVRPVFLGLRATRRALRHVTRR